LSLSTGLTTTLSALVGLRRAYLFQEVSRDVQRVEVDMARTYSLHAGASSKAILAYLPTAAVRAVLARLDQLTASTTTDPGILLAQLERIRRDQVVVTHGERWTGLTSIACPIFGAGDEVFGSVSVPAIAYQLTPERVAEIIPQLQQVAAVISLDVTNGYPDDTTHGH
jgi:DNA-binding IclR family transcriptional regulator